MDYKPVHVITNYPVDKFRGLIERYHVEAITGSEDYTEEEGLHYHYLLHWPVDTRADGSRVLRPIKATFTRTARRQIEPRCACWGKAHNEKCQACGIWFKFKWCQDSLHARNTFEYIEGKLVVYPEWRIYGHEH